MQNLLVVALFVAVALVGLTGATVLKVRGGPIAINDHKISLKRAALGVDSAAEKANFATAQSVLKTYGSSFKYAKNCNPVCKGAQQDSRVSKAHGVYYYAGIASCNPIDKTPNQVCLLDSITCYGSDLLHESMHVYMYNMYSSGKLAKWKQYNAHSASGWINEDLTECLTKAIGHPSTFIHRTVDCSKYKKTIDEMFAANPVFPKKTTKPSNTNNRPN